MADKLTVRVENEKGLYGIDEWMKCFVNHKPSINKGFQMTCFTLNGDEVKRAVNRTGILFDNCRFMRQGTQSNHGFGGSNCVTGNPICFVDISTVLPAVFKGQANGILQDCNGKCFLLPLCMLNEANDLLPLMNDAYVNFIAMKYGDNVHNITHVANGICSSLAAICFALCSEITLNSSVKPNVKRLKFLVEGLFTMGLTARSLALYSEDCKKIFSLLTKMANTADTFQSVLISYIFNQLPCESIRVKMLSLSIFRYFNNTSWNKSYFDENPTGLIGLLLIAPMLSNLMPTSMETPQIINEIIRVINQAIMNISNQMKTTNFFLLAKQKDQKVVHLQNKTILKCFAKASKVPFVKVEYIDAIYDAVLKHSKDVAKTIGIIEQIPFVDDSVTLTLKNVPCNNFPVLVEWDSKQNSACYIPSDVREWTAISLKPNAEYLFRAETLGMAKFQRGNTSGQDNIANFRFTAGLELLNGQYEGISSAGMHYNPLSKKFTQSQKCFDPNDEFKIVTHSNEVTILQDDEVLLKFIGPNPLVCFKYCSVTITMQEQKVQKEEIDTCLSLKDCILNDSVRMNVSDNSWGKPM